MRIIVAKAYWFRERAIYPERFSTRRKRLRCAWRILCLLNGYLRLLTLKIIDGIHHDGCRVMSKNAILKREEGIGHPRNLLMGFVAVDQLR